VLINTTDFFDFSKIDIVEVSSFVSGPLGDIGLGSILFGSLAALRYTKPPVTQTTNNIRIVESGDLALSGSLSDISELLK
jgi:hypothetical protein